ncbi:hypothetical protein BJX68DRAFT_252860 [Aspergillus pseudodeflectus]|uniref:Nucleoside phosphorylase domain-containing protein n=1 Tax=Aspergillus pseudodeflectus TaxID=176178 RepID=A0ABR4L263_9EURO
MDEIISNQATRLGLDMQDNPFAQLGGELFILTQQIQFADQREIQLKVVKIAELLNKACSISKAQHEALGALRRISECKESSTPTEIVLAKDNNPEYPSLLRLIADCLHATNTPEEVPGGHILSKEILYPAHVNNTLYTQLRMYSTCSCTTQHLDYARLRLDPEHDQQDAPDVSFDLLFLKGHTPCEATCQSRWKEAKAKRTDSEETGFIRSQKLESFFDQKPVAVNEEPRKVELGEFCKLIGSEKGALIHFHIKDNVMKLADSVPGSLCRSFLPQSTSLSAWLEKTVHLSNRVKITLAYTIARSVWQYYSSHWMTQPWTHENIQIMKQNTGDANHIRPHPYFITKLHHRKGQVLDYCIADDLFHMYPNILSLGMVLVEIATKQAFKPKTSNYAWDETTINDYYEWAWTTANSSDLRNTIGAAYQAVVNNCLDAELFKGSACDLSKPDDGLENRQTILYEKIDDWETYTSSSKPTSRSHFSIAIFCALPLEADAVSELFDETWNEDGKRFGRAAGDDNAYTFGNILHHNVVLIHMAGMGKAAASQAASSVRSSYPEIKLALIVGVCGGVPSYSEGKEDLILGDVVISDGIMQYDFGRRLRGFLAKLKGVRRRERLEAKLLENVEGLQNTLGSTRAGYPGIDKDELYHEAYRHKHRNPSSCKTCAYEEKDDLMCEQARLLTCQQVGCQKSRLVQRKRLLEASADGVIPKPRVHFGFVGSGDTVIKSGHHRDLTAAQHNLIAFEMEASGIWDNLPCLVIKGVCDYADSHKNKHWEHYAAATAAACMKAVLEEC